VKTFYQPENPKIELLERNGETTLYIDGREAMQAWERGLMWESADIVCSFGSRFLEVGLGLGFSALRIASAPTTLRHTVVEKFRRVIDLFSAQHPNPPPALEIVCADFFDRVLVERRQYTAYQDTEYTSSPSGSAYIQCFIKAI
jgi:hypothetical protein